MARRKRSRSGAAVQRGEGQEAAPAQPSPLPPLLAFALRHAAITAFPGSRQRTAQDGYRLPWRTCPDWNLIRVWEGAAVWTVEGVDHRLERGDLILVPPGVRHCGRSAAREMVLDSVHALAALPGGQDLFALFAAPRVRRVGEGERLAQLMRLACDEYERVFGEAMAMIPAWTALVVKELFLHDHLAGLLSARGGDPLVAELLDHLERNLARRHTLAELAARAGYAPQHLNRRFRRETGTTPLAWLAALRLERAAELLRAGRLSVQAVGRAVGWEDPAYFSRVFARRYGCPPSAFRAQGETGAT
jgi:AraC-like DNA-binding protein